MKRASTTRVGLAFLRLTDSPGLICADEPSSPAPTAPGVIANLIGGVGPFRRRHPRRDSLRVRIGRLPNHWRGGPQPDRGDSAEHTTLIDGRTSPRLVCSPEPQRPAQGPRAVLRAPAAPCSGHQRRAHGTGGSRGLPPIVAADACLQTDLRRSRGYIVVNSFGPAKGNWPLRRLGDGLSSTFVAERVGFEPTVP
jgi:hypothetical protein